MNRRVDWTRYLADFHQARPGITEDVLERCSDSRGQNPYHWLVDGIDPTARVLDLACGSAPTRPLLGTIWIGIDRSLAELHRAVASHEAEVVRADATQLPIRSGSVDVVVCSMALMLIEDLGTALAEIARILVPGGELRATLPHHRALTTMDRLRYLRLAVAAGAVPVFPRTALDAELDVLRRAGMLVTGDEPRRFTFPLGDPAANQLFVNSWYTRRKPDTRAGTRPGYPSWLQARTIGVGLRRVVATR